MRVSLIELTLTPDTVPGFNEFEEPLGLCYVAEWAFRAGHHVCLIQQTRETDDDILARILAFEPDILGATAVTAVYPRVQQLTRRAKALLPGMVTVLGGSHACAYPEQSSADFEYVVVGEGEETFVSLLDALRHGKEPSVPGLCYCRNGRTIFTGYPCRIRELDGHHPFRDGLPRSAYDPSGSPPVPAGTTGFAAAITSRGCPGRCSFCCNDSIWRDRATDDTPVAFRSPRDIVAEVQYLKQELGVNYIVFEDTDFFLRPRDELIELAERLLRDAPDIKWACLARPERILNGLPVCCDGQEGALTLLAALRESGCHLICLGVESGDERLRHRMGRNIANDAIAAAFELLYESRIMATAFLMLGLPEESDESLQATSDLVSRLKAIRLRTGFFYPFGNTNYREKGSIEWLDPAFASYEYATTEQPTVRCDVSADRLIAFKDRLEEEFYCSDTYAEGLTQISAWSPFWSATMDGWRKQLYHMRTVPRRASRRLASGGLT